MSRLKNSILLFFAPFFILLSSCDNSSDIKNSNIKSSKNLVISFVGFYNSESRNFSPEPIGYAGVDYDVALQVASSHAVKQGYTVADQNVVETEVLDKMDPDRVYELILLPILSATNSWLQSADKSCPNCKGLQGLNTTTSKTYSDWVADDQIVIIVGLETLSPVNFGLNSGLAAFVFDAKGNYEKHFFQEYNFSQYTTEPLIKDLKDIIDFLAKND
ncbi:MAG: hypothetical protein COB92_04785 [Robiginitomaculum sp.]|nr:MAG: hypothetical protein COB92_04785 [Robiginitomaculum sp.]